jgi:Holliday junction resolvase RusA-like endonuclease
LPPQSLDGVLAMILEISIPPSVNRLWRVGRRRVFCSPQYIAWLRTAGWELLTQRPARFTGPVRISIAAGRPDRRRRDLDNIATKALLDLLVAHRVIDDDSLVAAISSKWDDNVAAGRVHVDIRRARASRRRQRHATPAARGLDL